MSARSRRAGSEIPVSADAASSSGTSASNVCGSAKGAPPSHLPTVRTVRVRRSSTRKRNRHVTPRRRSAQSAESK